MWPRGAFLKTVLVSLDRRSPIIFILIVLATVLLLVKINLEHCNFLISRDILHFVRSLGKLRTLNFNVIMLKNIRDYKQNTTLTLGQLYLLSQISNTFCLYIREQQPTQFKLHYPILCFCP